MAKYQAYAEYKDSGVEWLGEIPSHWEKILFKRVVLQVKDGTHGTHQRVEEGSYLLSAKNVFNHGIEIGLTESRIPNKDYQEIVSNGFPKKGDILVTCVGTIGRSCVYTFEKPIAFQRSVAFLRLNSQCDSKYYKYFIESKQYQSQLESLIKSSAQGGVYMGDLINTVVANCDFLEQKQISNFLDHETSKIDHLIEKQQQLIELLKEKRQAVISHAVTKGLDPNVPMRDSGVEWLGEVPEHWQVGRIKHLAQIISKGTTPTTMGGDFVEEGIRFLKAENIGKGFRVNNYPEFFISEKVDEQLARSRLKEHDVLVIIAGATTGLASVLQKELLPANTNQAVSFIRLLNFNYSHWVSHWLTTQFAQSVIWMGAVQAAQPNLSMESLGNIYIAIPPVEEVIEILKDIEFKLESFESLINKAQQQISLMQERRTALISAAVTGKIDVRNWQAPTLAEAHTELNA